MADITWPFSDTDPRYLTEAFDEALEFNVELSVARSGRVTTLALPGARWRLVMQFPDTTVAYLLQRRQRTSSGRRCPCTQGVDGRDRGRLVHLEPKSRGERVTMRVSVTCSPRPRGCAPHKTANRPGARARGIEPCDGCPGIFHGQVGGPNGCSSGIP